MRIFKIEDCLELMCGLLPSSDFEKFPIAEKDTKLLNSIANATYKGKALSDRQYDVVRKILLSGYKQDFTERNVDIQSSVNNIRLPLRRIDRSEYIAIEKYEDNLDGAGWRTYQETGKCLTVRFPFNMKYSKIITEIKKFILYPDQVYKSDNYKHILPFTEQMVYRTIDMFQGMIKDIQPELIDMYNELCEMKNNKEKYIPGIYNLEIKNISDTIAQPLINKIGLPSKHNLYLYQDKRDQIGLEHFDTPDLDISKYNLQPLSKKIIDRKQSLIQILKKEYNINQMIESLLELKRFPLLVILDDKKSLDSLISIHNVTKNIFDASEISVLFRKENKKEGKHFNDYIKEQQINNKLDINTKIVYINNKKIPKDLMKGVWEPECVISLESIRNYNKIDKLIHQYDLTIHYDREDGYWNDMVWSIEKI